MTKMQDRLALHTWTLDTTPLPALLRAVKNAGWNGIELRHADFKRCYDAGMSNAQVLDLVRGSGLEVATVGCEYGILFAKGEERRRLMQSLEGVCASARALGCDVIMSATGPGEGTARDAVSGLKEAAGIVQAHGLRLAYEYSSAHDWLNNLKVAREILAAVGHPSCGLLIDAYHFERTGAGGRGFEDVPGREIFAFQYSDVPDAPLPAGAGRPIGCCRGRARCAGKRSSASSQKRATRAGFPTSHPIRRRGRSRPSRPRARPSRRRACSSLRSSSHTGGMKLERGEQR